MAYPEDHDRRLAGLALIVVVGMLTLLAVFGAAWTRMAGFLRNSAGVTLDRTQARLLAHSGLSYAAARLSQDSVRPDPPTAENQPDDWGFRDDPAVPLELARNPSYAITEPYLDVARDGACGGADPFTDLDHNGRFDSWSGRLRGSRGPWGETFVLKIESEGSKIDINGGMLEATDVDGQGVPDYCDLSPPKFFYQGKQLYDDIIRLHNDPRRFEPWVRNFRIADTVNQLGRILKVGGPSGILQQIGDRLILNRPLGGYRNLDEARRDLPKSLLPVWERLERYLTVGSVRHGRAWGTANYAILPGFRVQAFDLAGAPVELLQSLFAGLGPPYWGASPYLVIHDDEARRTAELIASRRSISTRYELFRALDAEKLRLFPQTGRFNYSQSTIPTSADISRGASGTADTYDWDPDDPNYSHVPDSPNMKVNFVAHAAEGKRILSVYRGSNGALAGAPFWSDQYLQSWQTYDLPRAMPPPASGDLRVFRFPTPWQIFSWSRNTPDVPFREYRTPLPLSLDPPPGSARMRIESLGRTGNGRSAATASAAAHVQTASEVTADCQADFENLVDTRRDVLSPNGNPDYFWVKEGYGQGGEWIKGGIVGQFRQGLRFPGTAARWDGVVLAGRCVKDRIQAYPCFPLDSCPDFDGSERMLTGGSTSNSLPRGEFGRLALMSYTGRCYGGEAFHQPLWEAGQPLRDPPMPRTTEENFRAAPDGDPPLGQWFTHSDPVVALQASARLQPGSAFWWSGKTFPWRGEAGEFKGYTFDFWGLHVSWRQVEMFDNGGNIAYSIAQNKAPGLTSDLGNDFTITVFQNGNPIALAMNDETAQSVAPRAPNTYRRITATFSPEGDKILSAVHVDGVPDPGLTWDCDGRPEAPWPRYFHVGSSGAFAHGFGARLLQEQWTSEKARAAALQDPCFWTGEAHPAVTGVPSYTSPLYIFPGRVSLAGAAWDGFVPALIRDAGPVGAPLKVDILGYTDPRGLQEDEHPIELPREAWRTGGGAAGLEYLWHKAHGPEPMPKFRALRYRIWMDASAVQDFNNETPILESIRIAYHSGRTLTYEER